jgi:farnesyl-diphosphate farnesyltransferase
LICRIADTIEDAAHLTISQKGYFLGELNRLVHGKGAAQQFARELCTRLSGSVPPAESELIANAPVVMQIFADLNHRQQNEIKACIQTMSKGMLYFQGIRNPCGLETLGQMKDYCYCVAGVVGEMLTGLFCEYSDQIDKRREAMMARAASFGQGLQMTNILKDLWEDRQRGVCWLAKDVFKEAGFELESLDSGTNNPGFGRGLASVIGTAHAHLQNALDYTLELPIYETGIRKFCMWAIGLALATLQNINSNRGYSSAREVTVSPATTRQIIDTLESSISSNVLLDRFFRHASRGLPLSEAEPTDVSPGRPYDGSFGSEFFNAS